MRLIQLLTEEQCESGSADELLASIAEYADGIGPPLAGVIADGPHALVAKAHQLNLVVHPYTVRADDLPPFASSLSELLKLLVQAAGVDGLFTDHPDKAVAFLQH